VYRGEPPPADAGYRFHLSRSRYKAALAANEPESFALPGDAETIRALLTASFDPYTSDLPGAGELEAWIGGRRVLAVRDGARLAGFLHRSVNKRGGTIHHLVTAPESRGQGVGGRLLNMLAGPTEVWVTDGNEPALRLYTRHGFRPDGVKMTAYIER